MTGTEERVVPVAKVAAGIVAPALDRSSREERAAARRRSGLGCPIAVWSPDVPSTMAGTLTGALAWQHWRGMALAAPAATVSLLVVWATVRRGDAASDLRDL